MVNRVRLETDSDEKREVGLNRERERERAAEERGVDDATGLRPDDPRSGDGPIGSSGSRQIRYCTVIYDA